MAIEITAFSDLVSAVIVQASIDYVEAYRCGLICENASVNSQRITEVLREAYPTRCPLPKWMEPSDVYSCVSFLFESTALEDVIPTSWEVSQDAVRRAVIEAAKEGKAMNHFFNFEGLHNE